MPAGFASAQPAGAEIRSQPTKLPGLLAWAVAGDGQLCVAEADAGGGSQACAPATALTSDLNSLLYTATAEGMPNSDADEVDLIVGLAPDGVSQITFTFGDRSSAQAAVVDNGFQLQTDRLVKVASLSWYDAAGALHTQEVGRP
jgi:hypothetical protein